MDEQQIRNTARLVALETVLVDVARLMYALTGVSPDVVRERHDRMRASHDGITLAGYDAAWSDHISAEYNQALHEILKSIEDGPRTQPPTE